MKFLCLLLIVISTSVLAEPRLATEKEILYDSAPPLAPFPNFPDLRLKHLYEDCPTCMSDATEAYKFRQKYYASVNEAAWKYNDLKKDDPKKLEAKIEYYQETIKFLEANSAYRAAQYEYLKKKATEAEKVAAQCKAEASEKESLLVNDSNRSFLGKISEIFSWKRDTPAPVEDRGTSLSK